MTTTTVKFEDQGQDFLEWDIDEKGNVIDCRPFQASIWNGTWLLDHPHLKIGEKPAIITPRAPRITALKYPITEIVRH